MFGYVDYAQVPAEPGKELETKARPGPLVPCLSFAKYLMMLEDDRSMETTHHCLVRENQLPMKKWTNVIRVNKNEFEELFLELTMGLPSTLRYSKSSRACSKMMVRHRRLRTTNIKILKNLQWL